MGASRKTEVALSSNQFLLDKVSSRSCTPPWQGPGDNRFQVGVVLLAVFLGNSFLLELFACRAQVLRAAWLQNGGPMPGGHRVFFILFFFFTKKKSWSGNE